MVKEQARILFEDLHPEIKKTVKEIKQFRRTRGASEILFFISAPASNYIVFAPISAWFRKESVKRIKGEYEKLAELIQEKGFLKKEETKKNYPKNWIFNHEQVIENFPVMHINRRGDIVFRKPTKMELIKIKLHMGRHRKLFKKPKTQEEIFLERIKKRETLKEKKFGKIFKKIRRTMRK